MNTNGVPADKLHPIGTVVEELRRTFPDVSHSSLRFLEREGLIQATRTPGGHRLYSEADIDRIRQIKTWQAQRLSLEDVRHRLRQLDQLPDPAALAETFLRHAIAGERPAAVATVLDADDAGLPLAQLFGDVFQPALVELGSRWEHGKIFVAQEKEVSEIVRDLVAELTHRHASPYPDGPAIVAACVEGERHELGLRMVCGLLLQSGYPLHYLGADVAPRFLLESVRLHRPAVVLLSAKLALNLPAVKDAIDVLAAGLPEQAMPAVVVGGRAASEHADAISGWGAAPVTGERIDAVLEVVHHAIAKREGGH
jgi:methanogenic corrinoid protein MtbC1